LLVNSICWKDVVMPIKCFRKNIMYMLTPFVTKIYYSALVNWCQHFDIFLMSIFNGAWTKNCIDYQTSPSSNLSFPIIGVHVFIWVHARCL
jgi:hypothetical protein